jgi:chromosome partitioning protein
MAVITVAGLKGGIGKTTIVTGLGACFHAAGVRTVIVDADPRRMVSRWAQIGQAAGSAIPEVVNVTGAELAGTIGELAASHDVVLIDSPPWLGREIQDSLLHAHVVLLPVMPGAYDIWVLQETLALLAEARKARPSLRAFIIPNATDHTKASEFMTSSLPKLGVPVIGKGLSKRALHRDVALAGAGVTEFAPTSTAAEEMRSLFRAVRGQLTKAKKGRA